MDFAHACTACCAKTVRQAAHARIECTRLEAVGSDWTAACALYGGKFAASAVHIWRFASSHYLIVGRLDHKRHLCLSCLFLCHLTELFISQSHNFECAIADHSKVLRNILRLCRFANNRATHPSWCMSSHANRCRIAQANRGGIAANLGRVFQW